MQSLGERAPRAVLFDYGNTLVGYGARELALVDEALASALEARYGPVDRAALAALHGRQRAAVYREPYRENALADMVAEAARALCGASPDGGVLAELLAARRRAFDGSIAGSPEVPALLERLAARFRLALVSNYPCGDSIRASLARLELARFFEVVVVSGDLGYVKPHPAPFEAALRALELVPEDCVYVGDNWLGDVQGAKRLGMRAVHIVQYDGHEHFDPAPDDLPADATIARLDELPALLGL